MLVVEAVVMILAVACAYPMVAGALRGPDAGRRATRQVAAVARGSLWLVRRAAQPALNHGEPPWCRADDYVVAPEADSAETQRDAGSVRPSAVPSVLELALLDIGDRRDRGAAITLMAALGWTTAEIRAVVKGENAAIGAEVDAARRRLGVEPPPRFVTISGGKQGKVAM